METAWKKKRAEKKQLNYNKRNRMDKNIDREEEK